MQTRGVTLPRPRRISDLLGFGGSVPLSMPLGLMLGRPFKPFRRAISSRCSPTTCFRAATSPNNSTNRASSSARLSAERTGGDGTWGKESTASNRRKEKMERCPHFCSSYGHFDEYPAGYIHNFKTGEEIRWKASCA